MTPLHVTSVAQYVEQVDDNAPAIDLKNHVLRATGVSVRRVTRFIQLALIGAGRAAQLAELTSKTAVYVGSSHGDLETIIDVLRASLRDGRAPKPLSFINTVSNAACYYVAQTLQLFGRSTFVCNRYFAFESALQLAVVDLANRESNRVLLGVVDVVVAPLAEHRERLGLDRHSAVADASHWITMSADADARSLCRVLAARSFADRVALQEWIAAQRDHEHWILGTGQFMSPAEGQQWQSMFGGALDYRLGRPHYDSQSGAVIQCYAHSAERRPLLHINCDPSQRYSIILLDKPATGSSNTD